MRYFCSGTRVIRVLTDAPLGSDDFMAARTQVFSMRREVFIDRPQMIDEIVYTGDWNSCTEPQAMDLIATRLAAAELQETPR